MPLTLVYGIAPSPFGTCVVALQDGRVAVVAFPDKPTVRAAEKTVREYWRDAALTRDDRAVAPFAKRVFAADRDEKAIPTTMNGTDFQKQVWAELSRIKKGSTTTYTEIAKNIGRPNAVRAVGAAVGRNPLSHLVPCHRVLGRDGALTGYHWGLARKRAMLAAEDALPPGPWSVYILRCADGTFYAGVARDLDARVAAHNKGAGAKYTRPRRPVEVVYREPAADRGSAQSREAALKALTRAEKEALVARAARKTKAAQPA